MGLPFVVEGATKVVMEAIVEVIVEVWVDVVVDVVVEVVVDVVIDVVELVVVSTSGTTTTLYLLPPANVIGGVDKYPHMEVCWSNCTA